MSISTFAVDENNDLFIGGDGDLAIISGLDAVIQSCEQAAKSQLGEMFLQTNRGIPNFQVIWNGSPNISQFQAALRTIILGIQDVTDIKSLETRIINNTLFYTLIIVTIYGIGVVNGQF